MQFLVDLLCDELNFDAIFSQRYDWQWVNIASDNCLLNCLFRRRSKKHQRFASLAFVRGIHRWPVNSPHRWPVLHQMFPFDDVTMLCLNASYWSIDAEWLTYPLPHWPPGALMWYFGDVIFKLISVTDGWSISAAIWMSLGLTDDWSILVKVMAWSQCRPRSVSPFCVTMPQWVNK